MSADKQNPIEQYGEEVPFLHPQGKYSFKHRKGVSRFKLLYAKRIRERKKEEATWAAKQREIAKQRADRLAADGQAAQQAGIYFQETPIDPIPDGPVKEAPEWVGKAGGFWHSVLQRGKVNFPYFSSRLLASLGVMLISSVPINVAFSIANIPMSFIAYILFVCAQVGLFFVLNWILLNRHFMKVNSTPKYCTVNVILLFIQFAICAVFFRLADMHRFGGGFLYDLFSYLFGFTKLFRPLDALDVGDFVNAGARANRVLPAQELIRIDTLNSRHYLSLLAFWMLYFIEILLVPYFGMMRDNFSAQISEKRERQEIR